MTVSASEPEIIRYGPHPEQFGECWSPAEGSRGTVMLIHGGYWRHRHRLTYMRPLAADLAARGYRAWNVEFRRIGTPGGGGWPETFQDVSRALEVASGLADRDGDRDRLAVVGHSAGGHLALWSAGPRIVPDGVPVTARPGLVVSLAGVTDLVEAADRGLSDDAAALLLGGQPSTVGDRYALACPTRLLPLGVPQLVVHGDKDVDVPCELAVRYADAARAAGDPCELMVLPGVEHFALIDPPSDAWRAVASRMDRWSEATADAARAT